MLDNEARLQGEIESLLDTIDNTLGPQKSKYYGGWDCVQLGSIAESSSLVGPPLADCVCAFPWVHVCMLCVFVCIKGWGDSNSF